MSLFAEPSVYGFTDTKKIQYKQQLEKRIVSLEQKLLQQEEKMEGLNSLVEGLISSLNNINQTKKNSGVKTSTLSIKRLEKKILKIETNYVTKKEFFKKIKQKDVKKEDKLSVSSVKQRTTATLFHEGVNLFVKRRFSEAKKRFVVTDEKGYKTASSNYYLGEIAYYRKDYENAIFFFQKSAGINDETSYIPTLLLHTAISLEKTGKKAKAKIFYENVIVRFEGKKVARVAKDKLKKL
jgi:TolA-binding protein